LLIIQSTPTANSETVTKAPPMDLACRFVLFPRPRRVDSPSSRCPRSSSTLPISGNSGMVPLSRKYHHSSVRSLVLPPLAKNPRLTRLPFPPFAPPNSYAFELTDLFTHERIMRLFPGHKMHLFGHSPDGVSLAFPSLRVAIQLLVRLVDLSSLRVFPLQAK